MRLGLLGAAGSPWVGEGQGLLRGEGTGEDPGPEPAPGCRCWGRISSTSSSTSPGTDKRAGIHHFETGNPYIISTLLRIKFGISWPSLLTFHIVIIVAHVRVLCEQGGAGRGGDASTDPLHTHLFLQTLNPAGTLQTDVNHLTEDLQCIQETLK